MKISGFTMVKNGVSLYYPIKEAILSILPIVDEFVVALGDCHPNDKSRTEIESIDSDKIRIIDTVWDLEKYPDGMENAHQTDIAKEACSGDWLFYLQADEVVHEDDLLHIQQYCEKYLDDPEVEGFLFHYLHFWASYDYHLKSHGWYQNEIRIVRNRKDIHSWESAQSFRRIPDFDGINYRQQEGTFKLKVIQLEASIYHYGWVRPPALMQNKRKALDTIHKGETEVKKLFANEEDLFDYGPLKLANKYQGSHPKVMKDKMKKFDWQDKLRLNGPLPGNRKLYKHEKMKYRILSWVEQHLLGGKHLFTFRNYKLLKK